MEQNTQGENIEPLSSSVEENLQTERKQMRLTAITRLIVLGIMSFVGMFSGMAFDAPGSEEKIWPYLAVTVFFWLPVIGFIMNFFAFIFSFSHSLERSKTLIRYSKWIWWGSIGMVICAFIVNIVLTIFALINISR